jgi:hypothetical protein
MSTRLLRCCATLWGLGLAGTWVARALLALEPHDLPVQLLASLWLAGGLGYTGLGLLALSLRAR